MNKENINKLADTIENLPFKEEVYLKEEGSAFNLNKEFYHCGAPACIAGWAVYLAMPHTDKIDNMKYFIFEETVQKFMDIDRNQFRDLCYPFYALDDLDKDFDEVTPQEAAKVLRNFAETGIIEWSIVE